MRFLRRLADGLKMMFVGIGLMLLPLTEFAYWRLNARKAAVWRDATAHGERGAKSKYTPSEKQMRRMGDRAPDFEDTLCPSRYSIRILDIAQVHRGLERAGTILGRVRQRARKMP
ncbi:hypothetical protein C8Q80DRAFT_1266964 [Daedaleopsis nitida]|nr:hypothetical protein C8Q80DRAFT_1266964 [Daedaleopsis nitida]